MIIEEDKKDTVNESYLKVSFMITIKIITYIERN